MPADLPFEKPLTELRQKIAELKRFTEEKGIDFSAELATLEEKANALEQKIFGQLTPWQRIQIARHPDRPTTLDYINHICTDFLELHGDRTFGDDPAIVGGIAKLDGMPITVIGHQKGGGQTKENLYRNFGMAHPEGYRKALRLMKQAEKFRRPILCFIDTAGAYAGMTAEERGIGEAIARNLREMAGLRTPIISIVTGEGGSGGALGLGVADRVYILENAYYSVIAPESAAALLWKDATQAERAANTMKILASDLYAYGLVDGIIKEPLGGIQKAPEPVMQEIHELVKKAFAELLQLSDEELVEQRYLKFKAIGRFSET